MNKYNQLVYVCPVLKNINFPKKITENCDYLSFFGFKTSIRIYFQPTISVIKLCNQDIPDNHCKFILKSTREPNYSYEYDMPDFENEINIMSILLKKSYVPNIRFAWVCSNIAKKKINYEIIMDMVEGQTLDDKLDEIKTFESFEKFINSIKFKLIATINDLMKSRVLHRDLHPSNVIITSQGDIKIIDFGLSVVFDKNNKPVHTPDITRQTIPMSYFDQIFLFYYLYYNFDAGKNKDIWICSKVKQTLNDLVPENKLKYWLSDNPASFENRTVGLFPGFF